MRNRFHKYKRSTAGTLVVGALLSACASPDPDAAFADLNETLSGRVPDAVVWRTGGSEDAAVDARIEALIAEPLTAQSAVQVALLGNRSLQARYASLGIAQADVVQAGLLENPVFEIMVRPSTEEGTNFELGLMQNFVDLLMRPARQKLAESEYETEKLELASHLIDFAGEVRGTYYSYRGALGVLDVAEEILSTATDASELAQAFHKAGNISDLELVTHQVEAGEAEVERLDALEEANEARVELAELLGVHHDNDWSVPARPPTLPESTVRIAGLEDKAVASRFDLASHRAELRAAIVELGLEEDFRLLEEADLAVSAEREPEGEWLIGPALEIPLPLFDQGQAKVGAAAMAVRRAQDELAAKELHIRLKVRKAVNAMTLSRRRAENLTLTILPLKERIVRLTLLEYNYMLEGPFHLLEAQQEQNKATRDYVEALTDYWTARAELQATIGGGDLPTEPRSTTTGDAS